MTTAQDELTASMYDRIGGGPAVRDVVEQLYEWILADKQLLPYFDGVDISRVKRHMAALLSQVLGGPQAYAGGDLGAAHSRLAVTPEHYGRVVDLAAAALLLAHAPRDVVAAVEGVLEATRPQIVGQSATDGATDGATGEATGGAVDDGADGGSAGRLGDG